MHFVGDVLCNDRLLQGQETHKIILYMSLILTASCEHWTLQISISFGLKIWKLFHIKKNGYLELLYSCLFSIVLFSIVKISAGPSGHAV